MKDDFYDRADTLVQVWYKAKGIPELFYRVAEVEISKNNGQELWYSVYLHVRPSRTKNTGIQSLLISHPDKERVLKELENDTRTTTER